jgi:hypothetical protein
VYIAIDLALSEQSRLLIEQVQIQRVLVPACKGVRYFILLTFQLGKIHDKEYRKTSLSELHPYTNYSNITILFVYLII